MPTRFPVTAHLLLLRNSSVLLSRRQNTGYEDGKLSVPAGHVEPGESVTAAALREAQEEVGLQLSIERLHVVGVMHRKADEGRVDFFLAYPLLPRERPENTEPEKCSELLWTTLSDPPNDTIPYVREALKAYSCGQWFSEFGWS